MHERLAPLLDLYDVFVFFFFFHPATTTTMGRGSPFPRRSGA
jgi:hypothetical protein